MKLNALFALSAFAWLPSLAFAGPAIYCNGPSGIHADVSEGSSNYSAYVQFETSGDTISYAVGFDLRCEFNPDEHKLVICESATPAEEGRIEWFILKRYIDDSGVEWIQPAYRRAPDGELEKGPRFLPDQCELQR